MAITRLARVRRHSGPLAAAVLVLAWLAPATGAQPDRGLDPGALAMFTSAVAARYLPAHGVRLLARSDRAMRAGDHTAFTLADVAAVGFRESREQFARQHNATDTIDTVSFAYLAQNTRVNVAAASLALAPPAPELAGVFHFDDRERLVTFDIAEKHTGP